VSFLDDLTHDFSIPRLSAKDYVPLIERDLAWVRGLTVRGSADHGYWLGATRARRCYHAARLRQASSCRARVDLLDSYMRESRNDSRMEQRRNQPPDRTCSK